jgi:16S rRNA processing protein RimM
MAHPYDPETVVLGVVGRPHGVHGELWLRPHNVRGRSFEGLRELLLFRKGALTTHAIVALRLTPDGALVKLAGVETREAAAAFTLAEIHARRTTLPPLGPGEFYVDDAIGCDVLDENGRALGVVAGTFWNGAHDIMTVKPPEGDELLIPLLPQFVVSMDAPGRKIVVRWDGHE